VLSYGEKIVKIGLVYHLVCPLRNWKNCDGSRKFMQIPSIYDPEIALLIVKKEEINTSKIYSPVGNLAEWAK